MNATSEFSIISPNRKYWFIRAQSGAFYKEFREENYVGIGWDAFNEIELFERLEKAQFIQEIRKKYPKVKKPGYIYEQIKRFFNDISIGDIVMVPNFESKRIAFGEVMSDVYTQNIDRKQQKEDKKCHFVKRRKIKWLKTIKRADLDPHMFKLVYTHGAVTNASPYADYIDRTLHSFFTKGDKAHLVLRVTKKEKVYTREMIPLLNGTSEIIESLEAQLFGYSKGVELKVDVQSPGPIEFIFNKTLSIPVFKLFRDVIGGLKEMDQELTEDIIDLELEVEEKLKVRVDEVRTSVEKLKIEFKDELKIVE